MPLEIDPESLRATAGSLALLPLEIDRAPRLDADPVSNSLRATSVGAALSKSNAASTRAKEVLKARYNQFSALLMVSADTFNGADEDVAGRLAAAGDINAGIR
ncbi:hypothetical protein [Nocardia sp. NBC_01329]|uniref:hypothetical protein n=1 Tax=Nocardia sp. NBC_01329 TaxID=2903594 RepID=UPI002E0EF6A6|nr:hypothetical protein OG405_15270 [Nocardia sp. NBC_01329]